MNPVDPLDQLPPLILPDAPGWWPPAPGWWVLAALVLIAIYLLCAAIYRRYRANRLRRAAIDEANALIARYHAEANDQQTLRDYNALLKRFCLQQFPALQCASLSGERWLAQLDQLVNETLFNSPAGRQLTSLYQDYQFRQPDDIRALHSLVVRWLRKVDIGQATAIAMDTPQ